MTKLICDDYVEGDEIIKINTTKKTHDTVFRNNLLRNNVS